MRSRGVTAIDVHVGKRIRLARLAAGMSQEQLGRALGLTFQQVQKYEKGLNRVGAGRLLALAQIFSLPVSYFFEGVVGLENPSRPGREAETAVITEALSTPEGIRIARALGRIGDANVRRRIADLLESIILAEGNRAVA